MRLDRGGARVKAARGPHGAGTCRPPGVPPASWAKGQDVLLHLICREYQAPRAGVHGATKHRWEPTVEGGGRQHPLREVSRRPR